MLNAWLDLALGSCCVVCDQPGKLLCQPCSAALPQTGYRVRPDPEPEGLAPIYVAGPYADPLRPMLLSHKEHRAFGLARPLGRVLAAAVRGGVGAQGPVLLVAVPSSRQATRARGHDPVARMVRAAGAELRRHGLDAVAVPLLRQSRVVQDQAGLDASARVLNLAGSLAVVSRAQRRIAGRQLAVVVCDDIVTTGATAREAQRALAEVGLPLAAVAAVAATTRRVRPGMP